MPSLDLASLDATLNNSNSPLSQRFRALFELKSAKSDEAVAAISKAFVDKSVLLKHEVAYVLGQMKLDCALPSLMRVLSNLNEDPMVRHEAAEAIGAIGSTNSITFLQTFLNDKQKVVRETVQLAIDLLKFNSEKAQFVGMNEQMKYGTIKYESIDPAPPSNEEKTTKELQEVLMDRKLSLFERYRAMFALRNKGDSESVLALATGFEDESALFRHEIAYVFGQMQHPASVPSLITVLQNPKEEGMVRHEAAEALGSIAADGCAEILMKYRNDSSSVVRESCEVGLDMLQYEQSTEFEPIKTIQH